jgi:hypothetical protein
MTQTPPLSDAELEEIRDAARASALADPELTPEQQATIAAVFAGALPVGDP